MLSNERTRQMNLREMTEKENLTGQSFKYKKQGSGTGVIVCVCWGGGSLPCTQSLDCVRFPELDSRQPIWPLVNAEQETLLGVA